MERSLTSFSLMLVIRTIETRLVPYSSRNIDLPVPDFGFPKKTEAEPTTENGSAASTPEEGKSDDAGKTESSGPVVGRKRKYNGKSVGEHIVAKKDDEIRGHTAYLTFATKFFK